MLNRWSGARGAAGGFVLLITLLVPVMSAVAQDYQIDAPTVVLRGIAFDATVVVGEDAAVDATALTLVAGGVDHALTAQEDGSLLAPGIVVESTGPVALELRRDGQVAASADTRAIPGWVSILPPLLAILVALLTRNVVPALFLGVWFGAFAVNGFSVQGAFVGLLDAFQV
ncbi:MAG: hypothetical protein ACYTGC_16935, partial [Planctomycetota bacterium]